MSLFSGNTIECFDYFVKDTISLSEDEFVFLLPDKNIIFVKSGNKKLTINIESIFFATGEYRQYVFNLFKGKAIVIPDYKTASLYLTKDALNSAISLENLLAIKNDELNIFDFIHREMRDEKFFETLDFMSEKFNEIKDLSLDESVYFKNLNLKDRATDILSNSLVYSLVDMNGLFRKNENLFVRKIEYSNKRAITGRIICVDKFNIHTIAKNDLRRKAIVSRFEGGCLVNFDYTSFETMLSMYLTKDKDFISEFSSKDLHEETSKIIYEKSTVNQEERKFGKNVNHAIIFGAGRDTIIEMLTSIPNKENIYQSITGFLSPILKKAKTLDGEYKKNGYIKNYFGTFVYPNKDYALYNNYVQSAAADIITSKIISVNNILSGYKSKIVTAIHDSIIIDLFPGEEFLLEIISKDMRKVEDFEFNLTVEKMNNLFVG